MVFQLTNRPYNPNRNRILQCDHCKRKRRLSGRKDLSLFQWCGSLVEEFGLAKCSERLRCVAFIFLRVESKLADITALFKKISDEK